MHAVESASAQDLRDSRVRVSRAVCESRSIWVVLRYHAKYMRFCDILRSLRLLICQQRDKIGKIVRQTVKPEVT